MKLVFWLFPGIVLWLLHLSNASPRRDKKGVHLTKIGDLSTKDILKIADESTPADKRFLSPESTQQNDVEKERNQYYQTSLNDVELTTPTDQEEKFVNLLKRRYQGTFPEYGQETEADYDKNLELEENLDVQPETVMMKHSDKYLGKNRDNGDFQDPDLPMTDNLDTFDSDSNVQYPDIQAGKEIFHDEKTQRLKPTKPPYYTTAHYQADQSDDEELNDFNEKFQSDSSLKGFGYDQDEAMGLTEDDQGSSGTDGVDDEQDEDNKENEKELQRMKEKLKNLSLKLKTNSSHHQKVKPKATQQHDSSSGIMDEFDELKTQQNNTGTSGDSTGLTGATKHHRKHHRGKKQLKKIQYIHTEDSQETGDAILDFLDKLLEKDPNKLRHDVLSMAKEMQNEDNMSGKEGKTASGLASNKKGRKKLGSTAELDNEVDQWISEMEKDKGTGTVVNNQGENNGKIGDDTELHDQPQESYPDHNDGSQSTSEDSEEHGGDQATPVNDKNEANSKTGDDMELHDQPQEIYPDHNDGSESTSEDTGEHGGDQETTMNNKDRNNGNYYGDYKEFHDQSQDIYPDNNSGGATEETGKDDDNGSGETMKQSEELKEKEYFDYEEFKEEALKMHNEFRRRHNAVALQWSDKLAKKAHQMAEQLIQATRSNFKRELEKNGQSIAILPYLTKNIAKTAVEKWYSEITKFSFANAELKPDTRDFTQIIWKNSKEVGMGFGYSPGHKRTVVVALYTPAGNKEDEIRENLNTAISDPYADIRKSNIEKHG